jgi:hypothetical protein
MKILVQILLVLLVLSPEVQAYLELRDIILQPESIKSIGIYQVGNPTNANKDLFHEFQNRITLALQETPWFDVYDYTRIMEFSYRFYKDDPSRFLFSLDAIIIAEASQNQSLEIKIHFPKNRDSSQFQFSLKTRKDLDNLIQKLTEHLRKRLPLTGEILLLQPEGLAQINLGKNFNIRQGDLLISFQSNRKASGIWKVASVQGLSCKARLLWQQENISAGDSILQATPELLRFFHSKNVRVDARKEIVLSEEQRIPSIDGKNISIFPHPVENAIVISDGINSFYHNLDQKRTIMIGKGVKLTSLRWQGESFRAAYLADGSLVIHDFPSFTKRILQWDGEPRFVRSQQIFEQAQGLEILDFSWDDQGRCFLFFIKGKGLFITEDFNTVRKITASTLYEDVAQAQISFEHDGKSFHVKTANNFDQLSTIYTFQLPQGTFIKKTGNVRTGNKALASMDGDGLFDYIIDDHLRTNLVRITDTSNIPVLQGYKPRLQISPDNDSFLYMGKGLAKIGLKEGAVSVSAYTQLEQFRFFPASTYVVARAILKDTNKDGSTDWKDNKPLFLFSTDQFGTSQTLVEDSDELLGLSQTGQYVFYRKGSSAYWKKIANR